VIRGHAEGGPSEEAAGEPEGAYSGKAMNRTKVVATVGPACRDEATLAAFIAEGVDVFRLNLSHETLDRHTAAVANIRAAAAARNATVAILGDLCGPKIRVGEVSGGRFDIHEGDSLVIARGQFPCTRERLCTNFDGLPDEVRPGQRILIDDGQVRLRAMERRDGELLCRCEVGGTVATRKGVNLPDTELSLPSLTEKDRKDLAWAVEQGLDYIALSFVRSGRDLTELRGELTRLGSDLRVVSKIERPEAVARLDEIIELSDAVMVARGDLGVEMDVARVPLIQKDITHRCARAGKPVIIATQMLQSMIDSAVPTRAEVSDVANAILDGADAVMLSAETSIGRHPIEALRVIRDIANQTEAFIAAGPEDSAPGASPQEFRITSAVVRGAVGIARELNVKALVVWTESGNTVRLLSKRRPGPLIVGLTASERVCRWMSLYYGVQPIQLPWREPQQNMVAEVDRALCRRKLAATNDAVVIIAGTHLCEAGATNALLIHLVGSSE